MTKQQEQQQQLQANNNNKLLNVVIHSVVRISTFTVI